MTAGNFFCGMFFTFIAISTFSRLRLFQVGTFIPSSALINSTVLLVVLEHPSIFGGEEGERDENKT